MAFELAPAHAQIFTLNAATLSFGNTLVNCTAFGGCAVVTQTVVASKTLAAAIQAQFQNPVHATGVLNVNAPTITLNPGGSSTQAFTFAPTITGALGPRAGDEVEQKNIQNGYTATFAFTGTGVAPVQSTSATNNGYVLVGSSNAAAVTVQNVGNGNLAKVAASISNLNGSVSVTNGTGYTGGGGTISLHDTSAVATASTTTTFTYTFAPIQKGQTSSSTVQVSFSDGNSASTNTTQTVLLTLTGTGVAPVQSTTSGSLTNPAASGSSPYVLVGSMQTAGATVTINNTGNGNLSGLGTVSNLNGSVSISGAGFSGSTSVSLGDTSSTTFTYAFQPTVTGASTGVGTASFSNGNSAGTNASQTVQFTYTGTGVAPVATMTGGGNYGLVGNSSTVTVTVQNTGNGNLSGAGTVSNLQGTIGGGSGLFTGASVALGGGSGLTDSSSQTISYTFMPTTLGTFSTSVTGTFSNGTTNTNAGGVESATITGTGVAPQEGVGVSNPTYALVNGPTATSTVTVSNTGNGNLAGADSPTLLTNLHGTQGTPSSSVFTGGPSTINLQDTSSVPVGSTTATYTYNFAPTVIGATSTTVVTSFVNGVGPTNASGSVTVTLSGTGVAPVESVAGSNTNSGYALVNYQSKTATVTQSNVGNGSLAGTGTPYNLNGSVSAALGSGYSGSAGNTIGLLDSYASGGPTTSTFTYTFAPTVTGGSTTIVTSSFSNGSKDGTNNAQAVTTTLTGTGVAPVGSLAATSLGYVLVTSSGSATVTVQNDGNGNLSGLGSVSNLNGSVSASNGTGFSGSTGAFSVQDSTTVGATTTTTYSYTFAPTIRGSATSIVTASFSNGSLDGTNSAFSQMVTLSATGVAPVESVSSTNAGYVRVTSSGVNSSTANITIQNIGDGSLAGTGTPYNLNGSVSNTLGNGYSGGTGGASISLLDAYASGGPTTSSYTYTFAPTTRGAGTTTVTINFNNGSADSQNLSSSVTPTITGTGVGPVYVGDKYYASKDDMPYGSATNISTPMANTGTAGASTISFGSVIHSTPSLTSTKTVMLNITNATNDGNLGTLTDLSLLNLSVHGPDASDFVVGDGPPDVYSGGVLTSDVIASGGEVYLPIEVVAPDTPGTLSAYFTLTTDENAPFGFSGDNFTYDLAANVDSIPEPTTLAILGLGLGGLGLVRWRKRDKSMS